MVKKKLMKKIKNKIKALINKNQMRNLKILIIRNKNKVSTKKLKNLNNRKLMKKTHRCQIKILKKKKLLNSR